MLKLITTLISIAVFAPSASWALNDSYSKNLIEKSVTAIEASTSKTQKMALAKEFKQLVIMRADQIGEASLTNKSYDAESSELVDLIVALDRATIKKANKHECAKALNGLLTDAGIENVEETEAQSWNQLQFSLPSKMTPYEFVSFRVLKAICE
ncbi:hypothetical protein B9G69_017625 [Bdellovibrio sp. SKB1291214]|uniref:hypothetical protein n=1 Tax=Bdellovibrio sp. SKB1291214 TaxID=1732569 RepID=UPI001131DE89|nr:hypothetical protein [Bdellovibrio sp. SKB1291214]UYL08864.1 hypothetical protein B9G69_017625 [Bdellovibrio sp. SKB1291214]